MKPEPAVMSAVEEHEQHGHKEEGEAMETGIIEGQDHQQYISPDPDPSSPRKLEEQEIQPCLIAENYGVKCMCKKRIKLKDLPPKKYQIVVSKINVRDPKTEVLCTSHLQLLTTVGFLLKNCRGFVGNRHSRSCKGIPLPAFTYFKYLQDNKLEIFPGTSICKTCREMAIQLHKEGKLAPDKHKVETKSDPDYYPRLCKFNQILEAAGLSPFVPAGHSKAQDRVEVTQKLQSLVDTCLQTLSDDGFEIVRANITPHTKTHEETELSLKTVLNDLKQTYDTGNYKKKIQVLTVAPSNWTIEKTSKFFTTKDLKCPLSQVKMARRLRTLHGPFAVPPPKRKRSLPADVGKAVVVEPNFD